MRIGICAPRSAMKSKPPAPTSGSSVRAQNSRTFGSIAFIFFGVNTRDSRPRCTSWTGGSSNRMMPGGMLDVGLDQLEDRASARPVRLPVDQRALDVLEAAQREEVVLLVVVERRFVPQPLPDRMRIGVDLEVVRVVVDVALAPQRHAATVLLVDATVRNAASMTDPDVAAANPTQTDTDLSLL